MEEQAAARVHRIGQMKSVTISKLVMNDTIEERILEMQEAKAALGKGALTKLSDSELRKSRAAQLKAMFK